MSRRRSLHRRAAGSVFLVALPLPSSLRRRYLPCRAAAAFVVAPPLVSLLRRRSLHRRAAGSAFVVAPPRPSLLRRCSLPCRAAGSALVIALLLPSSSRCRRFCIRRRATAGSAFVIAPPLPSSSSRRCLPCRAAAAFFVVLPLTSSLRCRCLHNIGNIKHIIPYCVQYILFPIHKPIGPSAPIIV